MINIIIDFKDGDKFNQLIRYIENNLIYGEAQEAMVELGENTAENMHETIEEERKRKDKGTHKLETAIDSKILNSVGGILIGVGEIAKLREEAPYWEMIDRGATYKTKTSPGFTPPPFEDGEFRYFKQGSSHTIVGIDFVGKAIRNLEKELKKKIEDFGGKLIDGMKQ
jgi:hypothetical protein